MKRLLTLALALALFAAATAHAATLHVTTQAETGEGSLGQTILEAGPGDTIEIPPGTYYLTEGNTLIAQGNILHGAGEGETTIVPTGGGEALTSANVVDATIAPAEHPTESKGSTSSIETRAQIIAVVVALAFLLLILDLVRRRRLVERYALLWMGAGFILIVLSVWTGGLDVIARRLMEMGIVPGAPVTVVKEAPFGDPIQVRVRGYHLALRRAEASSIIVDARPDPVGA